MKIIIISTILFLTACASTMNPSKPVRKYTPISDQHRAFVREESETGKLLYKKDQLAANATDFLFAKNILPNDSRIKGWIVTLENGKNTVYFMGKVDSEIKSFHAVVFSEGEIIYEENPKITAHHRSMFKARLEAMNNLQFACSERYNTVVLDNLDSWIVYVLAATTDKNKIMVGGHHKITISKETGLVTNVKPLSKSCLQVKNIPNSWPMMTHIVDSTPISIHSFLSLLHNKTIYVGTQTGLWKAKEGDIFPVK